MFGSLFSFAFAFILLIIYVHVFRDARKSDMVGFSRFVVLIMLFFSGFSAALRMIGAAAGAVLPVTAASYADDGMFMFVKNIQW